MSYWVQIGVLRKFIHILLSVCSWWYVDVFSVVLIVSTIHSVYVYGHADNAIAFLRKSTEEFMGMSKFVGHLYCRRK